MKYKEGEQCPRLAEERRNDWTRRKHLGLDESEQRSQNKEPERKEEIVDINIKKSEKVVITRTMTGLYLCDSN